MRDAIISIDQSALCHNLKKIKSHLSPTTKVMAMVKANAYGHGIPACVPALADADAYGVAVLDEALQVQAVCQAQRIDRPIIIMQGAMSAAEWRTALEHGFGCVIHSAHQLDWALMDVPATDHPTQTIWLKYNTGMNRLGFSAEQVLMAADRLVQAGYRLVLTSHFACADELAHPANAEQIHRFNAVLSILKNKCPDKVQGSLCNSAGIIHFSDAHHDWVRSGIALYGGSPVAGVSGDALGLVAVMQFTAKISAVHTLAVGESVGYGALWTADKPCRIGVVSVGYGDGYPRGVTGAQVCVMQGDTRRLTPIVGRVAMDMLMIDLTDTTYGIGDVVMLWGEHLPADVVAMAAGTISYELFCRTTARPTRLVEQMQ